MRIGVYSKLFRRRYESFAQMKTTVTKGIFQATARWRDDYNTPGICITY
ncbi:hypothetical protein HMPREF0880_00677 [Yokenella regensburgei ATCC 43003]|nr:hypothetical protein HMPREF0880_00677 [Yokenella regensburgei ATCC 43003]